VTASATLLYRVSFQGAKRPEGGVNHTSLPSVEVKERVEVYLHSPPPSGHYGQLWGKHCLLLVSDIFRISVSRSAAVTGSLQSRQKNVVIVIMN
jgi:hypothetical protein